jgi:hypothetical protein
MSSHARRSSPARNQRSRVLDVVPFEEEDDSPFVRAATGRGGVACALPVDRLARQVANRLTQKPDWSRSANDLLTNA